MAEEKIQQFLFRDLHPNILLGTASDRYAGWIGQIYEPGRYEKRTTRRPRTVGKQKFTEEVLPVESVEEYFRHFSVLEIDYTFYRPLLEKDGKPSQNFQVLRQYRNHLRDTDRLILKVPQAVFARKIRRGHSFIPNESYLDSKMFKDQFYEPAVELLGPTLRGLIFEQEYHRKDDRVSIPEMADSLASFFESIPKDNRYHVELRTDAYLHDRIFEVFETHGVGQVLSHWTWLPPLGVQFAKSGKRFFNSGRQCIIRLMTPLGMRYENAYAKAFPFNGLIEGMLQDKMVEETANLMRTGADEGVETNVIINNRSGGNAPLLAQKVAERFLTRR
jgi:uncharacterized protein YecE (DUF72 family)